MKNVIFSRIDERLMHGQVVMAWVADVGCNKIYIIDDMSAQNSMLTALYRKLAPPGILCAVLSVQKAIEVLHMEPSAGEKIMLLVKVPQVLEALIDSGVVLDRINLGGMGLNKSRTPFVENVSASPEEIASMSRMIQKGSAITYQMAPYGKAVDVSKLIQQQS